MNLKHWLTGLVALAVIGTSDGLLAGTATPDSIIVVPARKRVVHLAFQIARCKDVGLVAYNNSPSLAVPLIHVWNGQEWIQISTEDYQQGTFMSGEPRHVFILGDKTTLPPEMASTPDWARNAEKITSMDAANVINTIGKTLKFSPAQWKWLAAENQLTIEDRNSERRRYGRWGAPGKEVDLGPVKKLENTELPPPPIISEPARETKLAPKKVVEVKPETKADSAVKVDVKFEVKPEPKAETPKPEAAKVEAPKDATPKVEVPKVEAPKAEVPGTIEPKVEAPKTETAKPVAPVPPVVEKPASLAGPAATNTVVAPKLPDTPKAPEAPAVK